MQYLKKVYTQNSIDIEDRTKFYYMRHLRISALIKKSAAARRLTISSIREDCSEPTLVIVRITGTRITKYNLIFSCEQYYNQNSLTYSIFAKLDDTHAKHFFIGLTVGIVIKQVNNKYYLHDAVWAHEKSIPVVVQNREQEKHYICATSDIHISSKLFQEELFEQFIDIVNATKAIKYLIIAGDVVDGINVYKGQEHEIIEQTYKQQTQLLTTYLKRFRSDLTIIIAPGNHDSGHGIAEPQTLEHIQISHICPNVIFVTNPCYFKIQNIKYLIYHGRSINGYLRELLCLNIKNSAEIQHLLVKSGHLASMLGVFNVAKITKQDSLLIDDVPNIFHVGHTHIADATHIAGTTYINGGTFQGPTEYQKSLGIMPTVGTYVLINIADIREYEVCYVRSSI